MTTHHRTALAVALCLPLLGGLTACGGDSSSPSKATSTTSSTAEQTPGAAPSSTTSSTPTGLAFATSGVTPPAGSGKAVWAAGDKESLVMVTDTMVVTSVPDDSNVATTLVGRDAATGTKKWTLNITQPPGMNLDGFGRDYSVKLPHPQAAVLRAGQGFVVAWRGMTKDTGLQSVKHQLIAASFNAETGKQTGKTITNDLGMFPRLGASSAGPFAVDVYAAGEARAVNSVPGHEQLLFGDGSTGPVVSSITGVSANFIGGLPVVATAPGKGWVTWPPDTTKDTWVYQQFSGSTLTGKSTSCTKSPDVTTSPAVASPNGQLLGWGTAIIDLKSNSVRCLSDLSDKPVSITQISDAGDVVATANNKTFTLTAGSKTPTILQNASDAPLAVLPGGITLVQGSGTVVAYRK